VVEAAVAELGVAQDPLAGEAGALQGPLLGQQVVALRLRVAPPSAPGCPGRLGEGRRATRGYLEAAVAWPRAACPAARRAVGTRNGEQDT
jgi:hypothetical protein